MKVIAAIVLFWHLVASTSCINHPKVQTAIETPPVVATDRQAETAQNLSKLLPAEPVQLQCLPGKPDSWVIIPEVNLTQVRPEDNYLNEITCVADLRAMSADDKLYIIGWEKFHFHERADDTIEIFAVKRKYWHVEPGDSIDGSGDPFGFYRYAYRSYLLVFINGELSRIAGDFDRIQSLSPVSLGPEIFDHFLCVETFVRGIHVFKLDVEGQLQRLLMVNNAGWPEGFESPLVLFDVDADKQYEALVPLRFDPEVSVWSDGEYYFLQRVEYPDGKPIYELEMGVVAVELLGGTDHPFTYYPELVLK